MLSDYKTFGEAMPIAGSIVDPDSLGYIYVIGFNEADIVKIGSSAALSVRFSELQCANPFELHLRAAVSIYSGCPTEVEFAAHKQAAKHGTHIRGEWFEISVDDALRCIIEAAKSKRARYGAYSKALARVEAEHAALVADSESARKEALRCKLGMS